MVGSPPHSDRHWDPPLIDPRGDRGSPVYLPPHQILYPLRFRVDDIDAGVPLPHLVPDTSLGVMGYAVDRGTPQDVPILPHEPDLRWHRRVIRHATGGRVVNRPQDVTAGVSAVGWTVGRDTRGLRGVQLIAVGVVVDVDPPSQDELKWVARGTTNREGTLYHLCK